MEKDERIREMIEMEKKVERRKEKIMRKGERKKGRKFMIDKWIKGV